jgi:hypothetical protein
MNDKTMQLTNTIPLRCWPAKIILPDDVTLRVIDCPDEQEMVVEVYKLDEAA